MHKNFDMMAARGEVIQVTAAPVAEGVIINEDGLGIFFQLFYIGFCCYSFTYKNILIAWQTPVSVRA